MGLLFHHLCWSSWERPGIHGNKTFSDIFSRLSEKTGWRAIDRPKATGGCCSASAPSDINRSIRNTHTLARTHQHTHTLLMPFPVKHMCSIAHTSASQGQRQGCCFLICSVLTHHLQSGNGSWKSFVPVCACACLCVCLSPCFLIPFSPLRETCKNTNTCHVTSHRKESLGKKKNVFTKAGAWIAVWNSTEPSSHYCFLLLRTEAATFLYPYHMCLLIICTGDVQ